MDPDAKTCVSEMAAQCSNVLWKSLSVMLKLTNNDNDNTEENKGYSW